MKLRAACLLWLSCVSCAATQAREPAAHAPHARELFDTGVALAQSGDLTRAEQYLASAHRDRRGDRASLVALLAVCIRASRLRSALAYAEPYLKEHPRDVRLLQLSAALRFALGELGRAREQLERVLLVDPARSEAHYLLARVHAALLGTVSSRPLVHEHRRKLREHFARYLTLSPDGAHAEEARSELLSSAAGPSARRRVAVH